MAISAKDARQKLQRGYRRAASRQLRSPSFTYKRLELTRLLERMEELGERDPAWQVNNKDDAYEWARRLGVRVPERLGLYPGIADVPWDALPDRFVLKPTKGSSSDGVYLLERRGGAWLELKDHRELTTEDVVRENQALVAAGKVWAGIMLEELVDDPRYPRLPPVDYKVYTFYGTVGLIKAKAHGIGENGGTDLWRDFDGQWRDMGNSFHHYFTDFTIPPPIHGEELLRMASFISSAVPRPFLRVDLYDDARGPVFGEITPMPGGEVIVSPAADRMLGRLWEDAEARLRAEQIRAGFFQPRELPVHGGATGSDVR